MQICNAATGNKITNPTWLPGSGSYDEGDLGGMIAQTESQRRKKKSRQKAEKGYHCRCSWCLDSSTPIFLLYEGEKLLVSANQ